MNLRRQVIPHFVLDFALFSSLDIEELVHAPVPPLTARGFVFVLGDSLHLHFLRYLI